MLYHLYISMQKYRNFLKKEQDEINKRMKEGSYNAQIGIHDSFLNPTPSSYVLPMFRDPNNGSSSGIMPFCEHLQRPDALSSSRLNEAMIGSQNQNNLWSQQPQMSNHAQAPRHLSVLGNAPPAQSWVANPSGRIVMGDYAEMTPQLPNFGAVQSGPSLGFANFAGQSGHSGFPPCKLPPTEHASHPCAPGAFGLVGTPYQMVDGASTHMSQAFQSNALPGSE